MSISDAYIDFETSEWTKPLTWAYKDENTERSFDSGNPEVLLRGLFDCLRERKPKRVWAHNGGKFDWLIVIRYAQHLCYPMRASVKAGRVVFAEIQFPDFKVKLYDSYAVAQNSLKKCAESFNLKSAKLLNDDDYSIDASKWTKQRRLDGALADVRVLKELVETLRAQFESWGGELKATFSSSALSVLKEHVGHLPLIPETVNVFAREAYFGGRVEVFEHEPSFLLAEWDINSSYPYAMTKSLPWKPSPNGKHAIIEATVEVPQGVYLPVLPFRPETEGVYFPVGKWRGHFTEVELNYAVKIGAAKVLSTFKVQRFSEAPKELANYIHKLYASKATATGAFREFCKLSLNGSYGKFGQSPEVEDLYHFKDEDEADEKVLSGAPGEWSPLHPFELWYSRKRIQWPKHTNFALAAYVTAYARIHLHKLMLRAKSLCYVDTDSIHAEKSSVYETGAEIGGLKLEVAEMSAKYYAPKIYELHPTGKESHFACKGFPVNEEDFRVMLSGEGVTTERMQLLKSQIRTNTGLRRHGTDLPAVVKKWKGVSPKRKLLKGGGTRPWKVVELQTELHTKQPHDWREIY